MRGIATGANDFFFMTPEKVATLGIPQDFFVKAIEKTRDVPGNDITDETLTMLERQGRPTLLLMLGDNDMDSFPDSLRQYLREGERLGLPKRPLLSRRKPWYKMEFRVSPPFLFSYLGRRNLRFIRNTAAIVPLNGFLCLYPKTRDDRLVDRLWDAINHPSVIERLLMVGKTYGGGAIKVEPRSLENLPLPDSVIEQCSLPIPLQMRLFGQNRRYALASDEDAADESASDAGAVAS